MRDFALAQDDWSKTWPSNQNDRAFRMWVAFFFGFCSAFFARFRWVSAQFDFLVSLSFYDFLLLIFTLGFSLLIIFLVIMWRCGKFVDSFGLCYLLLFYKKRRVDLLVCLQMQFLDIWTLTCNRLSERKKKSNTLNWSNDCCFQLSWHPRIWFLLRSDSIHTSDHCFYIKVNLPRHDDIVAHVQFWWQTFCCFGEQSLPINKKDFHCWFD